MKTNFCQLCTALVISLIAAAARAELTPVSTNAVDLGSLYNYDRRISEFTLVNSGKTKVKILELISTCPCIFGEKDREVVEPGGKLTVKTHFNARTVHGQFSRGLWVVTDAPANNRTLIKVTGEVIPLFIGFPEQEITLRAADENTVFTNQFTLTGTTTNYFLGEPSNDSKTMEISTRLDKVEGATNTYQLTTIIKPKSTLNMAQYVYLPVNGPVAVDAEKIKFKFLIGTRLQASPSKLVLTTLDQAQEKRFYINTYSPEPQLEKLTWEPQIEGLTIKKEIFERRPLFIPTSQVNKKPNATREPNIRFTCTATFTPEALTKIMAMDDPAITFSYPDHQPAKMPLVELRPRTPPPAPAAAQQ